MKQTLSKLQKMKSLGQKITCITAYDASMAHWIAEAGIEVILVGDSLGMVVQGFNSTLPVSLDEMVYHTKMVQRGNNGAYCIADMPFMTDCNVDTALTSAARLMKEAGANMVKLEGGERALSIIGALSSLGIPVCSHLGLLPQSVEKKGYKVVGRDHVSAERLLKEAFAVEQAGADMLVLECVPATLAQSISEQLTIPVIGIGAGANTDGQVLVVTDVLGTTVGKLPKFSKNYLQACSGSVQQALVLYVEEVRGQNFPSSEHLVD